MKFSIRDVLLGTLIAGLVLGWWLERTQLRTQLARQPRPASEEHYELIVTGKDGNKLLLFEPRTGKTWERYSTGKWIPHTATLAESKRFLSHQSQEHRPP